MIFIKFLHCILFFEIDISMINLIDLTSTSSYKFLPWAKELYVRAAFGSHSAGCSSLLKHIQNLQYDEIIEVFTKPNETIGKLAEI